LRARFTGPRTAL